MPAMKRPSKKAEKIAYSIIGIPANLARKKPKSRKKFEQLIAYNESQLSR